MQVLADPLHLPLQINPSMFVCWHTLSRCTDPHRLLRADRVLIDDGRCYRGFNPLSLMGRVNWYLFYVKHRPIIVGCLPLCGNWTGCLYSILKCYIISSRFHVLPRKAVVRFKYAYPGASAVYSLLSAAIFIPLTLNPLRHNKSVKPRSAALLAPPGNIANRMAKPPPGSATHLPAWVHCRGARQSLHHKQRSFSDGLHGL